MMIPTALSEATRYLMREWGDESDGYRVVRAEAFGRRVAIECAHSDGSRWWIAADEWGHQASGDTFERAAASLDYAITLSAARMAARLMTAYPHAMNAHEYPDHVPQRERDRAAIIERAKRQREAARLAELTDKHGVIDG